MFKDLVQFGITIFSFVGMTILLFSLFRIPIKQNDKQIAIFAVSVGLVNFYMKFVIDSPYFFIAQIVLMIVMLTILRGYPLLYSFLVCSIGAIVFSVVDGAVTFGAVALKLTTVNKVTTNLAHFSIFHLVTLTIYLLVAFLLCKFSIGFSFINRRFGGKYSLKPFTFIWSSLLIIGLLVFQLSVFHFSHVSSYPYIMILATIVLLISIYISYQQNKKHLIARYGLKESPRE